MAGFSTVATERLLVVAFEFMVRLSVGTKKRAVSHSTPSPSVTGDERGRTNRVVRAPNEERSISTVGDSICTIVS